METTLLNSLNLNTIAFIIDLLKGMLRLAEDDDPSQQDINHHINQPRPHHQHHNHRQNPCSPTFLLILSFTIFSLVVAYLLSKPYFLRKSLDDEAHSTPTQPNFKKQQQTINGSKWGQNSTKKNGREELVKLMNDDPQVTAIHFRSDVASNTLMEDEQTSQNVKFNVPLVVWQFTSKPRREELSYLNQLIIQNNQRLSKIHNFSIELISVNSYQQHISSRAYYEASQSISRINNGWEISNEEKAALVKYVIELTILEERGGIFIDEYVSLAQNLTWLQNINSNIFVNKGEQMVQAEMVGFHSPEYSSPLVNPVKHERHSVQRYMRLLPAIEHYFIGCIAGCRFMGQLKREILMHVHANRRQLQQITFKLNQYHSIKTYEADWRNIFMIGSQLVLIKQREALSASKYLFSLDYYGLKTINKYYFPYKIEAIFTKYQYQKTYTHLAKMTMQQLETTIGPIRYILVLTPNNWIDQLLQKAAQNQTQYFIVQSSLLHKYLFPTQKYRFIMPNVQLGREVQEVEVWSRLPRIAWVFWENGVANSHATNQLIKRNIQHFAGQSGFKVIEVNMSNIELYLKRSEVERINEALYFSKRGNYYRQALSDLVRLALLAKYGGVYMDVSFVLLQNLDWLVNIAAYPRRYVFNRYGKVPQVFMFINPHYGSPFDEWVVDPISGSKSHWHLSYENNFIAAEPNSQLIIDWYEDLINYFSQPYSRTEEQFEKCGISKHRWSSAQNKYLLAMDAIKCVLGKKQGQLNAASVSISPANEYYGLWGISGYNGVQKFRAFTNFQYFSSNDNLFFRRYSREYVDEVIGRPRQLIKLYSESNMGLNNFLKEGLSNKSVLAHIHPHSYFNQFLFAFSPKEQIYIIRNGNLLIWQPNH